MTKDEAALSVRCPIRVVSSPEPESADVPQRPDVLELTSEASLIPMTSWRDSASDLAQADLDGLLNALLPFAQQELEKLGEFFPFGAIVTVDGESRLLGVDAMQDERPDSASIISMLLADAQNKREELRAVGICSDARATDSEAIRVDLEHSEGTAIAVLLPYVKKRFGRGIEYSALQAGVAINQIWTV
jgi:hypothetical protein